MSSSERKGGRGREKEEGRKGGREGGRKERNRKLILVLVILHMISSHLYRVL